MMEVVWESCDMCGNLFRVSDNGVTVIEHECQSEEVQEQWRAFERDMFRQVEEVKATENWEGAKELIEAMEWVIHSHRSAPPVTRKFLRREVELLRMECPDE